MKQFSNTIFNLGYFLILTMTAIALLFLSGQILLSYTYLLRGPNSSVILGISTLSSCSFSSAFLIRPLLEKVQTKYFFRILSLT